MKIMGVKTNKKYKKKKKYFKNLFQNNNQGLFKNSPIMSIDLLLRNAAEYSYIIEID